MEFGYRIGEAGEEPFSFKHNLQPKPYPEYLEIELEEERIMSSSQVESHIKE